MQYFCSMEHVPIDRLGLFQTFRLVGTLIVLKSIVLSFSFFRLSSYLNRMVGLTSVPHDALHQEVIAFSLVSEIVNGEMFNGIH